MKVAEPIAIIGIGCRFPGAPDPRAFWDLLRQGRSAVGLPGADRRAAMPGRPAAVGGWLDQVDGFDWRTLRIPPREARALDPQHRLLLEVAWEALEDAGLASDDVAGSRTGVHVGVSWHDYLRMLCRDPASLDGYAATGNMAAFAANRISFTFDLRGPSEAVDAACASSLLSVLAACRCLRSGEADLALAGGVHLVLGEDGDLIIERTGILSAHGVCRVLDSAADGVVRGEGAGLVVLKRLADVRPTDRVYALIRGGAANHTGRNGWIMAPSVAAQAELIRRALAQPGIAPADVDYVELHGAATRAGDATEVAALADVLGARRGRPCRIGSVKTNIGALEAAGGIAALIKVALSLHHGELPPLLHLTALNPDIDEDRLGVEPVRALTRWRADGTGRIAGVTATGLGGANAHIVLSGAPPHAAAHEPAATARVLLLSAPDEAALKARALQLAALLDRTTGAPALLDISYTLCERRTHYPHRLAVVGADGAVIATKLRALAAGDVGTGTFIGKAEGSTGPVLQAAPDELESACALHVRGTAVAWSPLFDGETPRVADLPAYPWQRVRIWIEGPGATVAGRTAADSPRAAGAGRASALRGAPLVAWLRARVAGALGLDAADIGTDQLVFDVGMTSISAVALRLELAEALGIELPSTVIFDHPTVARLAAFITEQLDPDTSATHRPTGTGVSVRGRHATHAARGEPIAIVGAGLRLPGGVVSLDAFWSLLRAGRHVCGDVPPERWDARAYFDADPAVPGRMCARVGAFLDDAAGFDAEFFGISPREALTMDPQQRLLLEVAHDALEDAGQPVRALAGARVGVFAGIMAEEYALRMLHGRGYRAIDAHFYTGNGASFAAGRLAFALGVRGPTLAVNTACSSSLVAVHLAVQSLRAGGADLALAGGVSLMISPLLSIVLTKAGLLAPDGRCKTFDDSADGIGRGEGAALVALKRLGDAVAAGDRVLAVIRGSAINHDGRSGGLTAPSGPAQQELLRAALEDAGAAPDEVSYLEAHGTGTALGDPIELNALADVFGQRRAPVPPLLIGSVKTNLGHLDSAAGIAGLLKVVASLGQREIPAHLHVETPTRKIAWERLPLAIPTEPSPWQPIAGRRLAGVSSFGLSGANAHVLLEEAPQGTARRTTAPADEPRVIALSARSPAALRQRASDLSAAVHASADGHALDDFAYTTTIRRDHHEQRVAILATTRDELVTGLEAIARDTAHPAVPDALAGRGGKLAFVFPGHGQQWPGMGRALIAAEPVFAAALAECDDAFRAHVDWSLLDVLGAADESGQLYLHRTDVLQPTLFALGVALARLWRSWGVEPDAVVGHSLGEITAAHVAGALTLQDAARVICHRGLLTREATGGAMALLAVDVETARSSIAAYPGLCVAAFNGPRSVAVSGDEGALIELLAELKRRGVPAFRIRIEYASHSPRMDPLLGRFADALAPLRPRPAELTICSTVTAGPVNGDTLDAAHWVRNLREPVRYDGAIAELVRGGCTLFVECGANPVLLRETLAVLRQHGPSSAVVGSMRRGGSVRGPLLEAAARLYGAGRDLRWDRIQRDGRFRPTPTYPWQRQRYWIEDVADRHRAGGGHPLLGKPSEIAAQPGVRVFEAPVSPAHATWLRDHRVLGSAVMPAAAWIELAGAVLGEGGVQADWELADIEFVEPLIFQDDVARRIQVVLEPADAATQRITIWSAADAGDWRCHVRARGVAAQASSATLDDAPTALRHADERCQEAVSADAHDEAMRREGLEYGPSFRSVRRLRRGAGEALAQVQLPLGGHDGFAVHPALLDGCLQALRAAAPASSAAGTVLFPAAVERVILRQPVPAELVCHAVLGHHDEAGLHGDAIAYDAQGQPRIELRGLHLRRAAAPATGATQATDAVDDWFHRLVWQPAPPVPLAALAGTRGRWLILPDHGGAADTLESRLRALGHGVDRVELDAGAGLAAWRTAVAERLRQATPCVGIVHLRGLDHAAADLAALHTAEAESTLPLLAAAQAALHPGTSGVAPRLCVVTRGAQPAGAGHVSAPALSQAPLWGLLRTIGSEAPALAPLAIDLPAERMADEIDALLAELMAGAADAQVAIRGDGRYVARLERAAAGRVPAQIDTASTWLVTGGFGGLGLETARWLVGSGVRALALVGRSAPGPAAERVVAELRAAGVRVHTARADLANQADVDSLLATLRTEMPPLRGVIHCAGVLADAVLAGQDEAGFRRVAAPKIDAAWNLHAATLHEPPDVFLLFGSVSGVLGTPGQANYAAANAFLDALAEWRHGLGLPAQSIAWGAWRGVGLAAAGAGHLQQLERLGLGAMDPDRALHALGRAMASDAATVVITPFDADRWCARHTAIAQARLLEHVTSGQAAAIPAAATLAGATPDALEAHVRRAIADVLGLAPERVDPARPFADMGLDSLLTTELRNLLEARHAVALPIAVFWEYPTLRALADHIRRRLAGVEPTAPEPDTTADDLDELMLALRQLAGAQDETPRPDAVADA
jgi:acyl transferase domain-containing protein